MIFPVVLSGGSGTRLWPASRSKYPKQLLPLVDSDATMLQATIGRLSDMQGAHDQSIVVCNEEHRFLVAEQVREAGHSARIVLEPEGRNTAPAAALAAFLAIEQNPNAVLLIMPADHVIQNVAAFHDAVSRGREAAEQGKLVTFGIVPARAETGYGYVQASPEGNAAAPVIAFVEKPDTETARQFVNGGEHFWNSGMFLFSARAYLENLKELAPDIYSACKESIASSQRDADFIRPDAASFHACPKDSIDYAVMEHTSDAVMVPLDAGWSDVGSWSALHDALDSGSDGNTATGDVILHGCQNTYVHAESRLVAAVGMDDAVIVETKDATLVVQKRHAQDVKAIVEQLRALGREEADLHRQVFRPWGSYDSLENMPGWQVKRLIVNPGAVLSLQKHAHRAEHWVVVRGKARIVRNEEEFDLGVNESTYIAIGDIHRIANPYDEPVHIIEVQCGDYLGEDDIVRLEDDYGREGTKS